MVITRHAFEAVAAANGTERSGLRVGPHFTVDGIHPYEEVEWETRDAVITDYRTGEVAFEQRDVEFPTSWSMNATTIVAQKYFRGTLGSPQRERSVKHMIDRVADTITEWGRADGYFADDESADTFGLELKHLLVHQKAAFNSPVWFNVGVEPNPQSSACFILSVEDEMSSILNWYVEEGTIFKGGSGSGVNLSRIRSSKEQLRGGGQASGPVSFMRGADASAGTIKSGGKTRRAAKMVILDVDHPDVEEFIWCKQREELKARALREAGFDMDLDGLDSASVQYQNANNSVRVTDDFMRAAERAADWQLKAITTGETIKTVPAADLMRQIAQAAWECADPGIQYDTTINDWHTTPNAGRINGSNPCSEYMHLDNSACNLASLNLRKFEADGIFDVESFCRAVEIVFTAQEILVGNSSYPTEAIGVNARAYRQLGLGYANLGGLLMSQGIPYDSDEGRAWAAAITALMTGQAYRTSVELAKVQGPFDGYDDDRDGMLRVLRKHRDALSTIDRERAPANVLDAAQTAWDGAVEHASEHGVRNAQASVLAPTGTIGLMMDCDTTGIEPDLGLVKMKKLVGGGSMKIVNQTVPVALRHLGYQPEQVEAIVAYIDDHATVEGAPAFKTEHLEVFDCAMGERSIAPMGHVRMMAAAQPWLSGAISKCVTANTRVTTADGLVRIGDLYRGETPESFRDEIIEVASTGGAAKTDAFYYGGRRPVRRIVLRSGHTVTGTENHRVQVAGDQGLEWRYLDEIEPGEYVAVQYGADMWSSTPADLTGVVPSPAYGSQRHVSLPVEMTEDLAFLLGAYVAEGHITRSNWTVVITNAEETVLRRVAEAWQRVFGTTARITRQAGKCPGVVVSSKTIVEFLDYLGCGERASTKRIPDAVLRSPRPMVLAFLQGLFLDAYASVTSMPKLAFCLDSRGLLDDLQAVLTNLGIVHGRISKYNAEYDKSFDEVYAVGADAGRLAQLVPFLEPDKAARAAKLPAEPSVHGTADVVPCVSGADLYDLVPHSERPRWRFLVDPRTRHVARRTVERLAAVDGVTLPEWLQTVLDEGLHFSPVATVSEAGEEDVFDLSVPSTHAFIGNGIVNHNTVNVPESATVEDIEHVYMEGWRLGLKALAIYRDNCKVAQPLSVSRKSTSDKPAMTTDEEAAQVGIVRRRLPRQRPAQTLSFTVGDAEGYMTAGEYPGDGLGEIFVNLGKQGSTLSGVMDAFAISVSIGLQYGVPLEAFVSKFINMRFEPAGMTDDSEVKFASSIVDYMFRRLAIEYLPPETRHQLNIYTMQERMVQLEGGASAPPAAADDTPKVDAEGQTVLPVTPQRPVDDNYSNAPMCYQCGVSMVRAGSCHCCPQCGTTSGCS
ncbi:MAG: vitamin B12-dependent ribonucleotide reductase [Actinobacteria bacterium]|nr:vitamin B12-dependent ribonucleotide reductase [Actinomycetota bacterium]